MILKFLDTLSSLAYKTIKAVRATIVGASFTVLWTCKASILFLVKVESYLALFTDGL